MKSVSSASVLALSALLLSAPFAAQESSKKETVLRSLNRLGDGAQTCGLGVDFHASRRAELFDMFPDTVLLFRGLAEPEANLAFRQDKTFWYLTGIESPDAAILLDTRGGNEILFLPRANPMKESWNGEIWDAKDEWVRDLTGFQDVRPSEDLLEVLEDLTKEDGRVGISMHPAIGLAGSYDTSLGHLRAVKRDPLDGRLGRHGQLEARLKEKLNLEVFDIGPEVIEMRRIKTEEELDAIRRACRAGGLAMSEAIRSTRVGLGEWDLDALMTFVHMREGADGPGYDAIVGSGINSCILHYQANNKIIADGDLILIDYGPEVDHYVTDITRTWPANGNFTERQAEIYDAVLAAQKAGIAAAKPGATLSSVDAACTKVMRERGFQHLRRHGACHYVGMEVHDPGESRKPLEPGVVFTIEPGLYELETGIGVRIEDVVVITEDGCEVLTHHAPKERAELEALVGETGLLDWADGRDG